MLRRNPKMISEDKLEKTAKHLYDFYENVVCLDYPDYEYAPHIYTLSEELENLCRDKFKNLCVAMPPRHSKSSMVTLALPLWVILNDPNRKILIVNAEASLSENFGIKIRDFIQDFAPLTDVYVSDVKHSSSHLRFEDEYGNLYGGQIKLVGASGGITGQDADYLIIDDPYKGFEDITPTLLNKKIEWFKTKILQRREPDTKLIICHTRWHTNDLQGYLKTTSPDEYRFVEFPAIKKDGTSLWDKRYSIDFLNNQKREMGERLFSSIYQQQPMDETGDFFNLDNLFYPESLDDYEFIKTVRSWDLAYSDASKGQINDSTAGILMSKTEDDKYIIHGLEHGQYGDMVLSKIKATAMTDTPNVTILLETGTKGGASKFLFNEYKDKITGYSVKQSEPIGSKVDRATPFKNGILDGEIGIYLPDIERGALLEQLKGFPLATHDDIIDACSYAYTELKGVNKITPMVGMVRL